MIHPRLGQVSKVLGMNCIMTQISLNGVHGQHRWLSPDLQSFWKVKSQKTNSPCQQRKRHTEPLRVRLDSSSMGDINLWLKQIPQLKWALAAQKERGARERRAALPHPLLLRVSMGLIWSTPLPEGKLLAFLAENDMPLVRSNQPWKEYLLFAMTPLSPANDIPDTELFRLQCWHFFRSVISSAAEKTETLFKTQIQRGRLGVQILTLR